jgi:arylsulfatase A-like enzyme
MDTVRAEDFPGGPNPVTPTPFLDRLRRESVVFPRAVSPCSWTLPSHASLFTGLYPWDHHLHNRQDLRLSPAVPQIADMLRPLKYQSAAFSSNFLVGPESGLDRGFDLAAWGEWWEAYLRGVRPAGPPHVRRSTDPDGGDVHVARRGGGWSVVRRVAPLVHRYPGVLDLGSRIAGRVLGGDRANDGIHVSPWIEPALASFLRAQSAETPVYAFINLLEAHEPYFPSADVAPGLLDWWKFARVRQDRMGWLSKAWDPNPQSMDRLRMMYRASIRAIDARIASIVRVFEDAGRWENTLFVLTSDHGQALGEHDLFFHMLRVDEAEVRIPLWVRWPRGLHGGRTATGWASLVDVLPTAAEAAGIPPPPRPDAVSLSTVVDNARPGPVFTVADGILADPMLQGLQGDRRREFDRIWIAAYQGSTKVTLDVEQDVVCAYDIDADPREQHDLWTNSAGGTRTLADAAREVGRRMQGAHAPAISDETEERLRAWGYL